ncbi:hypothetical protein F4820DRAFT_55049 [Hypoxylon rubiginosum]|uniref:Uncharacterized protein n=1 Tax=Hypoxylon rubiginosum TaxID=110542 RepID=A0ACB9YR36_9PEZI|nr:hypothetical protein F4820DRAFT_55049 [Hypoxylon rubiginosum]
MQQPERDRDNHPNLTSGHDSDTYHGSRKGLVACGFVINIADEGYLPKVGSWFMRVRRSPSVLRRGAADGKLGRSDRYKSVQIVRLTDEYKGRRRKEKKRKRDLSFHLTFPGLEQLDPISQRPHAILQRGFFFFSFYPLGSFPYPSWLVIFFPPRLITAQSQPSTCTTARRPMKVIAFRVVA